MKIPEKEENKAVPVAGEWRDIVDSIADAMLVVDSNFTIVRANKAFTELTRQRSNNVIGRKCFKVVHGATASPSWCTHAECLVSQVSVMKAFFEPHLGLDLLISVSPIRDNEGRMTGCSHVIRDVTGLASPDRGNMKESQDWLRDTTKIIAMAFARVNGQSKEETDVSQGDRILDELIAEAQALLKRGANFLRKYAGNLAFSGEEERYTAARQCHGVTKRVSMLSVEFEKLRLKLEPSNPRAAANIRALLKAAVELSRDMHRLARRLYPELLKEQDLIRLIRKESMSFSALTGKEVTLDCSEVPHRIPGFMSVGFVSILAEVLAGAGQGDGPGVAVALTWAANALKLSIAGKGVDYNPGFDLSSLGFSAIPEWVRVLKGGIAVETGHETGNRITVEVPFAGRKLPLGGKLNERQREILSLLSEGHLAKQIGAILNISPKTVEFHKYRMMKEWGVKSVVELVRLGIKNKLITP